MYLFGFETVSLCSAGLPGSHYIDQVGFKPAMIYLSLSPKYMCYDPYLGSQPGPERENQMPLMMMDGQD